MVIEISRAMPKRNLQNLAKIGRAVTAVGNRGCAPFEAGR
jgi:hypothetical protein